MQTTDKDIMNASELIDFRDRIISVATTLRETTMMGKKLDNRVMAMHDLFCKIHDIGSLFHTIIMEEIKKEQS